MKMRKVSRGTVVAIAVAIVFGVAVGAVFSPQFVEQTKSEVGTDDTPLYWVAPMDPNFRRDAPGKSPMGMALIPVFSEPDDNVEGEVYISPAVVNNLGVRTARAEKVTWNNTITTVGTVQFDEGKLVHIHPRVSGWVDKLYVTTTGDPVKKGEPLYQLYSPELVNAQEELVLALKRDDDRLIQATEDRLRALQIPNRFIRRLKKDRKIRQSVTFYSPQDGVVDNLNIRDGFFVEPGTMILSIGSLDDVWVEAEVFERQASLVNVNDQVTMALDYFPNKTWRGRVNYIYPTLDKTTRALRVRIKFENKSHELKPNMYATLNIRSETRHKTGDQTDHKTLVLPREALIQTQHQDRVVLALGEGRFRSTLVKVGRKDTNQVEVTEGLKVGDEVVISAQFLLDSESSKTADFSRMNSADDSIKKEDAADNEMDHRHHHPDGEG